MSTTTLAPSTTSRQALRAGGLIVAVSLVGNVLALLIGRLAGADMGVVQTGTGDHVTVGIAPVVLMTLIPIGLGTVALVVAGRWGARGWTRLAWLGLALGVLTAVMPFTVGASTATALTLATMHLVVGVAWFVVLRRAVGTTAA